MNSEYIKCTVCLWIIISFLSPLTIVNNNSHYRPQKINTELFFFVFVKRPPKYDTTRLRWIYQCSEFFNIFQPNNTNIRIIFPLLILLNILLCILYLFIYHIHHSNEKSEYYSVYYTIYHVSAKTRHTL